MPHRGCARVDVDAWPLLELLVTHSQCVRLELSADWRDVAGVARQLGSAARAAAMLAAVDHQAWLLTVEPDAYGDAELVIAIRDEAR